MIQGAERKGCQPRILYLSKLSFKNKREIKTKSKGVACQQICPTRNAKGSPSGRSERTFDHNLKACKETVTTQVNIKASE